MSDVPTEAQVEEIRKRHIERCRPHRPTRYEEPVESHNDCATLLALHASDRERIGELERERDNALNNDALATDLLAAQRDAALKQQSVIKSLRDALEATLGKWVEMANSGDAGNWDCEIEEHVIAARAALKKAQTNSARHGGPIAGNGVGHMVSLSSASPIQVGEA